MKKTDIGELPKFFDRYINLVDDIELIDALKSLPQILNPEDISKAKLLGNRVYAPEKWTFREIVQHVLDNERIQTYRALLFSRGDTTILPGYDENLIAASSTANSRPLSSLLEEFELVRKSSIMLFESMTDEQMLLKGNANGVDISPLSLGFQLVGHQIHHANIFHERYFPLLDQ